MLTRSPRPTSAAIGFGSLGDRHAFAGQRRFIGAEIGVLDDAGVGRDLVSGFHQDDVAGHDLMGGDALAFPVADHGRFRSRQRHQRAHRTLRPRFLKESQQRVEDHDGRDDDRLIGQGGFARVLQQPFDHRDHDGEQQNDRPGNSRTARGTASTTEFPGRWRAHWGRIAPAGVVPRRCRVPRAGSDSNAKTTVSAGTACDAVTSTPSFGTSPGCETRVAGLICRFMVRSSSRLRMRQGTRKGAGARHRGARHRGVRRRKARAARRMRANTQA